MVIVEGSRAPQGILLESSEFFSIELIVRELTRESSENIPGLGAILGAQRRYAQQQPGIRTQVVPFLGRLSQILDTALAVRLRTPHLQHPPQGQWLEAKQIIFDTDGQVGIVVIRLDR